MYSSFAEKMSKPDLIDLGDGIYVLRFEVMKVTSVYSAVKGLLARGVIRPGQTLVDSSSGIYGHALALVCRELGLKCHVFASVAVDDSIRTQLKYLGATYDQVAGGTGSLQHDQEVRVRLVHDYLRRNPDAYWMRQYHDDVHYVGYEHVANMLLKELGSAEMTLVGGVGTGSSTSAMSRYLRAGCPNVRVAGIQPFGSRSFGAEGFPSTGSSSPGSAAGSASTTSTTAPTTTSTGWTSTCRRRAAATCSPAPASSPDCRPAPAGRPPGTSAGRAPTPVPSCSWPPIRDTATSSRSSRPTGRWPRTPITARWSSPDSTR